MGQVSEAAKRPLTFPLDERTLPPDRFRRLPWPSPRPAPRPPAGVGPVDGPP